MKVKDAAFWRVLASAKIEKLKSEKNSGQKPQMKKEEYEKAPWYKNLTDEQKVIFETRLGMLCEDGEPSKHQMKIAWKEAVGVI